MSDSKDIYYHLLSRVDLANLASFNSDADHSPEKQFHSRDAAYTRFIGKYVNITLARTIIKELHKWLFFWLVVVAAYFSLKLIYSVIIQILGSDDKEYIISAIPIVITAFVSFISTVITIPRAIAKYLFNTKEDDNFTDIVKHTQEHDASGRDFLDLSNQKKKRLQWNHTVKKK